MPAVYSTVLQYSTVQYSTVQFTVQYSTVQFSLNGAVSNCRSLGAGDANVDYLPSHPHSRLPHLNA